MSRIALDRWQSAQTAEFGHHQDLRMEAYSTASLVTARYLGFDYEKDFKDKVIVEVGAGPRGSILYTKGNFKRGIIIEPLIDRWPANIRKDYEDIGVEIVVAAYEDLDIDEQVDETWFFNVVQHVLDPQEQLELAKKTSKVIRVFESIGSVTDTAHPHYITKETFTDVLGDFGQIYKGGTEPGFMVQIVIMVIGMRLITFSLFGDNPLYCQGAVENANIARVIYPEWTPRFYVAQDVPENYIEEILDYGAEVVRCQKLNSYDGLNWRFRPLYDPDVEYWISRDADSRLSWRERNAVDEWIESDKTAHLLRDCHNHGYTIMAGMFGINNKLFHERYGMINLDNHNANYREADQTLLQDKLWPLIQHDHVCHDHWKHSKVVGQPTYQLGDHVHYKKAYQVGLVEYVTENVYQVLSNIYPEGQDNRPFPDHLPMEHGIFVGQIIEADGKPRMNTDVRWEYELRGIDYD